MGEIWVAAKSLTVVEICTIFFVYRRKRLWLNCKKAPEERSLLKRG